MIIRVEKQSIWSLLIFCVKSLFLMWWKYQVPEALMSSSDFFLRNFIRAGVYPQKLCRKLCHFKWLLLQRMKHFRIIVFVSKQITNLSKEIWWWIVYINWKTPGHADRWTICSDADSYMQLSYYVNIVDLLISFVTLLWYKRTKAFAWNCFE